MIAYDAFQSEAGKAVADYVELDELLAKSAYLPALPAVPVYSGNYRKREYREDEGWSHHHQ